MAISTVSQSSSQIRTDFMKLLVAQLQHQDPLEPMDNTEMTSQLSQLSSLEQLENMNATFQEVLASQQRLQAMGLIGRKVDFAPVGSEEVQTGRVDGVQVSEDGIVLLIGSDEVPLERVQAVRAPEDASTLQGLLDALGARGLDLPPAPEVSRATSAGAAEGSDEEDSRVLRDYLRRSGSPLDWRGPSGSV
jgi:flagellar basal-body rod modification protein FlgD